MAIVKTGNMYGQVGKLGQNVYYSAMGETRSREKAASVSNPRTQAQMTQRVKWSNLVNMYRANQGWMKYAFETKKRNQSDYNKFMSVNVAASPIYLTKGVAAAGGCVVAPYIITQGSLTPIEVTKSTNEWRSNIYLSSSFTIGAATTIAQLTAAILPNNPAIREGDQLSFIRMTQMTSAETGVPYILVRKYEVILSSSDTRLVSNFLPLDYIGSHEVSGTNFFVVKDSGAAGGFVLILSRTIGGRTYVSTQSIIVANNATTIDAWSGDTALANAIASYGESEEPFLTTTTANTANQANVPLAILSIQVGNSIYVPGQLSGSLAPWMDETLRINFNADLPEFTDGDIEVGFARLTGGGGYEIATETTEFYSSSGSMVVTDTLGSEWDTSEGLQLRYVEITINGIDYRAEFPINTGGGLE